jgi:hypothetical protein
MYKKQQILGLLSMNFDHELTISEEISTWISITLQEIKARFPIITSVMLSEQGDSSCEEVIQTSIFLCCWKTGKAWPRRNRWSLEKWIMNW